MDNEIKEQPKEENEGQKGKKAKRKPSKILTASEYTFHMDKDSLTKLFPMFFLIAALGIFYIYNAHYAQRIVRKTDDIKTEIKELRAEYITIKSELMYQSKQSQVSKRLKNTELKELLNPPYKITYNEKDER